MTNAGWARPANALDAEPTHYWTAEGGAVCGLTSLSYVGPKLNNYSLGEELGALRLCLDCIAVLGAAPVEPTYPPRVVWLTDVFKKAWSEADARGEVGHRSEAGIAAVLAEMPGVSMQGFQAVNSRRAAEWHRDGEPWTLADWGNAMGGECGEAQNVIKKIRRLDTSTPGNRGSATREAMVVNLGFELADTITYAFLVAEAEGINLEHFVVEKFNKVSEEHGLRERL